MTVDELRKHLSLFDGDTPIAIIDPDASGYFPLKDSLMHLCDVVVKEVGGRRYIDFNYSYDDCIGPSIAAKKGGVDISEFCECYEKLPYKDGFYQVICRHGSRCAVESMGYYARLTSDGKERTSFGWACENVPDGFGHGYKVLMWNPKSYEPFGSFRQQ